MYDSVNWTNLTISQPTQVLLIHGTKLDTYSILFKVTPV